MGYPVCMGFLASFVAPIDRYIIIYFNPFIIDYIHFSVSCWNLIFVLCSSQVGFLDVHSSTLEYFKAALQLAAFYSNCITVFAGNFLIKNILPKHT
jgi:hypothetical protein